MIKIRFMIGSGIVTIMLLMVYIVPVSADFSDEKEASYAYNIDYYDGELHYKWCSWVEIYFYEDEGVLYGWPLGDHTLIPSVTRSPDASGNLRFWGQYMYTDERDNDQEGQGTYDRSGSMKVVYNLDAWGPINDPFEEEEQQNTKYQYYYNGSTEIYLELDSYFNNVPFGESNYNAKLTIQSFYKTNGGVWIEDSYDFSNSFGPFTITNGGGS